MICSLPWPPSVNRYWRHPSRGPLAGRHLISAEGREYRERMFNLARSFERFDGRVAVYVVACPPDKRRRDLDNLLKALLDALVYSRVLVDDSLVETLCITRGQITKGGSLYVSIERVP